MHRDGRCNGVEVAVPGIHTSFFPFPSMTISMMFVCQANRLILDPTLSNSHFLRVTPIGLGR